MSSSHPSEHQRPDPATMTDAEYADYMADPHAFHPEHHGAGDHGHDGEGHHVTSLVLLRVVLAVLVFFTILTVAASRGEIWLAETFDLEIPTLVNVFIAMSIATIKATFVVAIFMHLKWDTRLNLLVFLFTLMGVGLFIGFTAMDLGNRKELYDWKAEQIVPGGIGGLTRGDDDESIPGGVSMVQYAREKKIQEIGEAAYKKEAAKKHAHHDHDEPLRSADRTRAAHGLTLGLFAAEAPAEKHGDDHKKEASGGHGEDEGH